MNERKQPEQSVMSHIPVEYGEEQGEERVVVHHDSEMIDIDDVPGVANDEESHAEQYDATDVIDKVPGIERNPLSEQERHELGNRAIVKLGGLDEFTGNPDRAIGFDGTTKR